MEKDPISNCKYSLLQGEEEMANEMANEMVNEIINEQKNINNNANKPNANKPNANKYPEVQDNDSLCSFNFLNVFLGWRFFPSF